MSEGCKCEEERGAENVQLSLPDTWFICIAGQAQDNDARILRWDDEPV